MENLYPRYQRTMPEYVKEKLRNNPNLKKPKSPETRAKISQSLRDTWARVPKQTEWPD